MEADSKSRESQEGFSPEAGQTEEDLALEVECLAKVRTRVAECVELERFSSLLTDRFLLHFVRGRKFRAEQAFKSLKNYVTVRSDKYSHILKDLQPSQCLALDRQVVRVLKHRDPLGRLIFVVNFGAWDPNEVNIDEFCKAMIFIVEEAWEFESVERHGVMSIYNNARFSARHLFMWTPVQLKKCVSLFWQNIPIRHYSLHVINARTIASSTYNLIKNILPAKLSDRLNIYSSDELDNFYAKIPKEVLPESLGGILSEEEGWDVELENRIKAKDEYYNRISSLFLGLK